MKIYQKIILGGLVLAGLAKLAGYDRSNQSELVKGNGVNPPHGVRIKSRNGVNPPHGVRIESRYGSRVGRTAELFVGALDNTGIESARLFEDNQLIREFDDFAGFRLVDVKKDEAGRHDYFFEVSDEDGNVVRTSSIAVNYSGILDDRIPHVEIESRYGSRVGRTAQLYVGALDSGDNAGIERAVLYENGKPFIQFDDFVGFRLVNVKKDEAGRHSYRFEVTDKGGNTIKSSLIRVSFNQ